MANNVYFLTVHSEVSQVGARIAAMIPEDDRYELTSNEWMIKFDGSTEELAERAGIRSGEEQIGTGLALSVTTYSGRANTSLWDWLKAKGF